MRFWDTSAIVPLVVEQSSSARLRELLRTDDQIMVWWATPVECWSAFARLFRERVMDAQQYDRALANLQTLQDAWLEINPTDEIRTIARRIVRVHPLRAADAPQLAAALAWAAHYELGEFVSLDERLRASAHAEGFAVI